ncbi:TrbG/VirB9 family P-type conjugative transfer protein [Paraburkholderia sp. MPAMCS5]|uniref:TrbG/VirB9 family P-type conjugative transfer protein n=1 Tax=Paraburkholderia sp. MPAMCS5 TaxID=3112563 RepID=UPI002E199527|nr:TrbG/VirB9 family P-type conjugative transfer protein [Paraburkholderia sp. MPAMCS5]
MKHTTTLLFVPVLFASCLLQSACAEPPVLTGAVYDFDWRMTGSAEVEPYQMFDDGQNIYLQFADLKHVPAVFADTPGGLMLLRWHPDPPYIVVNQIESALVFRSAAGQARAVRVERGGPPRMARFGAASPSEESAVSPPEVIDRVRTGVNPGSQQK